MNLLRQSTSLTLASVPKRDVGPDYRKIGRHREGNDSPGSSRRRVRHGRNDPLSSFKSRCLLQWRSHRFRWWAIRHFPFHFLGFLAIEVDIEQGVHSKQRIAPKCDDFIHAFESVELAEDLRCILQLHCRHVSDSGRARFRGNH